MNVNHNRERGGASRLTACLSLGLGRMGGAWIDVGWEPRPEGASKQAGPWILIPPPGWWIPCQGGHWECRRDFELPVLDRIWTNTVLGAWRVFWVVHA